MELAGLLLALLIFASLPLCVWKPWIGMLIFLWLCILTPQHLVSGFAYHFRFALVVAIAILLGLPFTRDRSPLPRTAEVYLIGALWFVFVLSTSFTAIQPERASAAIVRVSKIFLMVGVTLVLFRDRRKLRLLLLVVAGSIGVLGFAGGLFALVTRGQETLWGPPESILADSNTLAFALTMALPFFVFLRYDAERAWARHLLLAVFGLSIVAVLATYSRGGMIVLLVTLGLIAIRTFKGDRVVVAVAAIALSTTLLTPPRWQRRVLTVTALSQDDSANQRARSAYVAMRLGLDHPLLGVGFEPFSPDVYEHYIPGYSDYHNAHNHYLQLLAEHGFTGALLFLALLASMLAHLQRIKREARGDPGQRWIHHCASALEISLAAYALGGVFLNRPYFEPFYQLVAATVLLGELQRDSSSRPIDVRVPHGHEPVPTVEHLTANGVRDARGPEQQDPFGGPRQESE